MRPRLRVRGLEAADARSRKHEAGEKTDAAFDPPRVAQIFDVRVRAERGSRHDSKSEHTERSAKSFHGLPWKTRGTEEIFTADFDVCANAELHPRDHGLDFLDHVVGRRRARRH